LGRAYIFLQWLGGIKKTQEKTLENSKQPKTTNPNKISKDSKCESRVKTSESLRTLRKPLRSLRLGKSLTAKNAKVSPRTLRNDFIYQLTLRDSPNLLVETAFGNGVAKRK
jgi:hypothetical protein